VKKAHPLRGVDERKIRQYGGTFLEVCRNSFRASQYDHSTDTFTKHPLSSRAK